MRRLFLLFCVLFFLPFASANFLEQDLISYYTLDDSKIISTNAIDSLGNTNATLVNGATSGVNGIIAQGVFFDGTNQKMSANNNFGFSDGDNVTISVWLFPIIESSNTHIWGDYDRGGTTGSVKGVQVVINTDGKVEVQNRLSSGSLNGDILSGTTTLATGAWYNIVASILSNGTMELYINGNKEGSQTTNLASSYFSSLDFDFASIPTNPVNNLWGIIDEVAVWSRKLNTSEVEEIYNNGVGLQYPFTDEFIIRAFEFGTQNSIQVFSAFFNNTLYSTNNGTINTGIINSTQSFSILVSAPGYISANYPNHNLANPLVASLSVDNNVFFYFRDEQSNLPIQDVNYTIISEVFSQQNSTNNNFINLSGLPQGSYELRYESTDYNPRSAFFFIPLTAQAQINRTLYLLNITEGDFYLPIILDENENVVPDSYFQALRWYVGANNTGEYRVVETSRIDSQGRATMFLEFNTVGYTFRLLQNTTLLQSFPQPKFLFAQTEFYRFSVGSQLISSYKDLGNIQIDLSFIQSVDDFFQLQFNDPNNFASEVCLYVTFNGFGTNGTIDQITKTCSVASSSTITQIVNLTNAGVFRAWAEVTAQVDGTKYELANIVFDNRQAQGFAVLGGFGLFLLFIILSVGVLLTIFAPIVGLGMIVLTLLAFSPALLGIVPLNPVWIGGLVVILFILGFLFARRETN